MWTDRAYSAFFHGTSLQVRKSLGWTIHSYHYRYPGQLYTHCISTTLPKSNVYTHSATQHMKVLPAESTSVGIPKQSTLENNGCSYEHCCWTNQQDISHFVKKWRVLAPQESFYMFRWNRVHGGNEFRCTSAVLLILSAPIPIAFFSSSSSQMPYTKEQQLLLLMPCHLLPTGAARLQLMNGELKCAFILLAAKNNNMGSWWSRIKVAPGYRIKECVLETVSLLFG